MEATTTSEKSPVSGERYDQVLAALQTELGLATTQGKRALALAIECVRLLDTKQQDYGSKNITYSGELGVAVRLQDKVCRLRHMLESGNTPKHEAMVDTYQDIANYGLIGQMLLDGSWLDG